MHETSIGKDYINVFWVGDFEPKCNNVALICYWDVKKSDSYGCLFHI